MCLAVNVSHATANERIPLWGATYYGMSVNEVLNSVTYAKKIAGNIKPPFPDHGMQALAMLDNLEISGEHFSVWFMFNDNKLNQVTLSMLPKTSESKTQLVNLDLVSQYANFTWLLNIKYGNPVKVTRQEFGPPISVWYAQWVSGLTNIDLNIDKSHLDLSYGAIYAEDLKAL
jgi:hypothetical protein